MLRRIRRRYEAALSVLPTIGLRPAAALREVLKAGYDRRKFKDDVLAGVVVGIVALPLSMALAIASGVPPQHGLYTAIVAGTVIAILGGSRAQISGPTAAFVVILAPIAARYGLGGLLVASLMAGVILVGLAVARLGKLIQYIPYPVTAGFTAGIATVIATLQLKDFFGLRVDLPEDYLGRVEALALAAPTVTPAAVGVGAVTLLVLLFWPRVTKRVPAPLVALVAGALAAYALQRIDPRLAVLTIGSKFSYVVGGVTHPGIPNLPPLPILPWHLPGPGGAPLSLSFETIRELGPSAFAIAMLGAIESLLSAVVADGLTDEVLRVLPSGITNPTVSHLHQEGWRALEIIVDEKIVREMIPDLKRAGAEGIIEYPLNKVIY